MTASRPDHGLAENAGDETFQTDVAREEEGGGMAKLTGPRSAAGGVKGRVKRPFFRRGWREASRGVER